MTTLIVAATVISLTGCGYRAGSLTPTDIRSVHVEMFDNNTFRRGLEFQLTEAVQREIRKRTDIRLADKDKADSILSGTIVEFRGRVEVRDVEDEVFTQDVTIYVNYKWVERRTGRRLAEREKLSKTVRLYSTYGETAGFGETIGFVASEPIRLVAESIVDGMFEDW